MRNLLLSLAFAALGSSLPAAAAQDITIDQAWSRATPGKATTGIVYMTVSDRGAPDKMIGFRTPVADAAELHESKTVGGMARMEAVSTLPISKDAPIKLEPGGFHLMLIGLKKSLKAGDHFPLTVQFEHAGEITTNVTVEHLGATAPSDMMGDMDMSHMH